MEHTGCFKVLLFAIHVLGNVLLALRNHYVTFPLLNRLMLSIVMEIMIIYAYVHLLVQPSEGMQCLA